jgi:nitroreductase
MKAHLRRDYAWQLDEREFPRDGPAAERLRFLIRYAVLAPSSHNTQPWKFRVEGDDELSVHLDRSRWLRVADADLREMHVSVGCALENLLVAAEHFGYGGEVAYLPDPTGEPDLAARVSFKPLAARSAFRPPELFGAIASRHTSHKPFEPRPVPPEDLRRIEECRVEDGIELVLTDDPELKRAVGELVARADAAQFADPAFREELGRWIGQGVFGASWLMAKVGQLAVTHLDLGKSTARKDNELLESAPALGLICSAENDRRTQVLVGQVFGRVYLTCAALGLGLQPVSQIVQLPEIKSELARLAPARGLIPQQPFRLGYAEPEEAHTPRRPLEEVLM